MNGSIVKKGDPDYAIIQLAAELRDTKYLKNRDLIRHKLIMFLSNPKVRKPQLKTFAQENGVSLKVVKLLRLSPTFKAEYARFVREVILFNDKTTRDAVRSFRKKVREGERWAVERVFKEMGVTDDSDNEQSKKSYDELIRELERITNKGSSDKPKIIDLKEGVDYELNGSSKEEP